jgi:hypothetical protein
VLAVRVQSGRNKSFRDLQLELQVLTVPLQPLLVVECPVQMGQVPMEQEVQVGRVQMEQQGLKALAVPSQPVLLVKIPVQREQVHTFPTVQLGLKALEVLSRAVLLAKFPAQAAEQTCKQLEETGAVQMVWAPVVPLYMAPVARGLRKAPVGLVQVAEQAQAVQVMPLFHNPLQLLLCHEKKKKCC